MKICFIGPSGSVIPPTGWGAVESLIWDYYLEVKKSPEVQGLILTDPISVMVQKCNLYEPDVVYIMYDDYAYMAEHLMCNKIYLMTHFAFITSPHLRTTFGWYYNEIFLQCVQTGKDIIKNLGLPICENPLMPDQNKFFKTVYRNPDRISRAVIDPE